MKSKKASKLKIITKKKSYPLQDSAVYKVNSKRRLTKILFCELQELRLLCGDENYRCFLDRSSGKPRKIQEPLSKLNFLHSRMASLLCRIATPNNLHSGRKGRSNISNARAHIGIAKRMLTVDLKGFYSNTHRSSVFDFFHKTMKCAPDVADLLSKLLTYNGHVPTGSRVSMPLAYFSNKKMFDELEKLAGARGAVMTIYVDDLTFSGLNLQRNFLSEVECLIKKYGHKVHPGKIRFFGSSDVKLVTGTAIADGKLLPRNRHLLELRKKMMTWRSADNTDIANKIADGVLGRMSFLGGIDSRYADKARSFRAALKKKI